MDRKTVDPASQIVRDLRIALGDTQQQFAQRMGWAISTVVRYELTRPPTGSVLGTLLKLAESEKKPEIVERIRQVLRDRMSPALDAWKPQLPFGGSEREWRYMRAAQIIAADERFAKLREPLEKLIAPVSKHLDKLRESSDESGRTLSRRLGESPKGKK